MSRALTLCLPWIAGPLPTLAVKQLDLPTPAKVVIAWLLGWTVVILVATNLE